MRGCRASCLHQSFVRDYQAERERQEIAAENAYRERDGNENAPRLITFKEWLQGMAGWSGIRRDMGR